MKTTFCLLALLSGVALAAPTPNYPIIYSAAAGGPVPNPAYASGSTAAVAAAPQAIPQAPPQALPQAAPQAPAPTAEPATLGRYAVDLNVGYAFKATPDSKYACDMSSVELEGAYYLAPHHALTLSLGYAGGGRTEDMWVTNGHETYPFTDSYDRYSYTIMGGYRYSCMLNRYFILQVGAKCGLDVQTLDVDYGVGWHTYPYGNLKGQDDTAVGMAYAGYAYLGCFVTPAVCLHVGYQFKGSTAKPSADSEIPGVEKFRAGSMRWHEVRVGLTFHF